MIAIPVILGLIVIFSIILFYGVLVQGLLIYKFYYWFLLPVFSDMPHITFAMAMGLSLVISLFKTTNVNDIKKEYKEENTKYVLLLTPWLLLLLGWIIKLIIY